jgi:hypothetical protein
VPLKLNIKNTISNTTIHWVDEKGILVSSKYSILKSVDDGSSFDKIVDLPVPRILLAMIKLQICSRLLRLGIRNVIKLKSGTILAVANRRLYRVTDKNIEVTYVFKKGFGPLREGWCEDSQGNCYLAEYFLNMDKKHQSDLLKSVDDGKTWEVVYSIEKITHIHLVLYDKYSNSIWLGTGDKDFESIISFSKDEGKSWVTIGSGDQTYRTVGLLFTREYVYWGSDAPTRQNYIFRYDRKSGKIEKLAAVSGPVYYSVIFADSIFIFGTTDEALTSLSDKSVHMWASKDGNIWEDIGRWYKDLWPYIFGFGVILLPLGKSDNSIFFTLESTKKSHRVMFQASVSEEGIDESD